MKNFVAYVVVVVLVFVSALRADTYTLPLQIPSGHPFIFPSPDGERDWTVRVYDNEHARIVGRVTFGGAPPVELDGTYESYNFPWVSGLGGQATVLTVEVPDGANQAGFQVSLGRRDEAAWGGGNETWGVTGSFSGSGRSGNPAFEEMAGSPSKQSGGWPIVGSTVLGQLSGSIEGTLDVLAVAVFVLLLLGLSIFGAFLAGSLLKRAGRAVDGQSGESGVAGKAGGGITGTASEQGVAVAALLASSSVASGGQAEAAVPPPLPVSVPATAVVREMEAQGGGVG